MPNIRLTLFFMLILTLTSSSSWTDFTPLNSSNFQNVTVHGNLRPSALQDVVKAIAASQNWRLRDTIVSKIDLRRAMIGSFLSYEFRVRAEEIDLEVKFANEAKHWKRLWKRGKRRNLKHLVNRIKYSKKGIASFELEGPFELKASGNDLLSLQLPLNAFHTGLRQLLVSEGITVEVKGASEVSLFQNFNPRVSAVKSERDKFWQLLHPSCIRIPSVIISGPATLLAYNKHRSRETPIQVTYVSERVIRLLPHKCYTESVKEWACPMPILRSKVMLVDKLVRSIPDSNKTRHSKLNNVYVSANIKHSNVIRFNLELERKVRGIANLYDTQPKWRTRPSVERAWFEIVAKYGSGKLKPLIIKKVKRFILADTASLSSLTFNISFTKFPSLLPPEALTLDIDW